MDELKTLEASLNEKMFNILITEAKIKMLIEEKGRIEGKLEVVSRDTVGYSDLLSQKQTIEMNLAILQYNLLKLIEEKGKVEGKIEVLKKQQEVKNNES